MRLRQVLPSVFHREPPPWLALAVCGSLVLLMGYLRLVLFQERLVPLTFALPLLVCLWARDKRLLWGMATLFSLMTLAKVFVIAPDQLATVSDEVIAAGMMFANIWVVTWVVSLVIDSQRVLERQNEALEHANAELEASNEELAAREEELSQQNEELHAQAEELEQQTEELRQQSEELESQSEQLRTLIEENGRRQRALSVLLNSSHWHSSQSKAACIEQICEAALTLMEGKAKAAAIVERRGDGLRLRGHHGFGTGDPHRTCWGFEESLAALVIERGETAYLRDVALRPDLDVLKPRQGKPFNSVLASPLRVDGEIVGAIEVFSEERHDWTEDHFRMIEWLAAQSSLVLESLKRQEEVEQRRHEAEEASKRKTRFLAAVSHDVRTPVNAINLMADLVRRCINDPNKHDRLPQLAHDLKVSAKSLAELVTDVLDIARFDSGRMELSKIRFSLSELVQAEVRQLQPIAEEKGIRLTVEARGEPVFLETDRIKIARVFGNLLGNAVKFTEQGGVKVILRRIEDGGVELCVTDSGVGISAEHLENLFDEFFQLRNPERDWSKGTGLGLAICKRLVEVVGCDLKVESTLGVGSKFTLHIPESLVAFPAAPLETQVHTVCTVPEDSNGRLDGLRVLLVEDHPVTRRATSNLLTSEGATVLEAEDGRSALHALLHDNPQVMLLDLMLPDMDGVEVLQRLRSRRPRSLQGILAVSGDVSPERREEVTRNGADDLIGKPVVIEELIDRLRQMTPSKGTHAARKQTRTAAQEVVQ